MVEVEVEVEEEEEEDVEVGVEETSVGLHGGAPVSVAAVLEVVWAWVLL